MTIHGQKVRSYGLGFFHGNRALPATLCQTQFNTVRNSIYTVYTTEAYTDMNFDTITKNKIKVKSGDQRRNLLRSSSIKGQDDSQHKDGTDEESHRQLQDWCYPLCSTQPVRWLITSGCRTECGLRRRLDESMTSSDEEESMVYDEAHGRELQGSSRGSRTNILAGQGDTTAAQFYATVSLLIPSSDSCRAILLNMTYFIAPVDMNL